MKLPKATRSAREGSAAAPPKEPARRGIAGGARATPWDEPSCDWGKRGYGQVRAITKAYLRDRYYGTW